MSDAQSSESPSDTSDWLTRVTKDLVRIAGALSPALMDGALFVAMFGAFAYAVGYNTVISDVSRNGIPHSLAPTVDIQSTILTGVEIIILATLFLGVVYGLGYFVWSRVSGRVWASNLSCLIQDVAAKHPFFYFVGFGFIIVTFYFVFPIYAPLDRSGLDFEYLPTVKHIELKESSPISGKELSLVFATDEHFMMRDNEKQEFIMISREQVNMISFEVNEKSAGDEISKWLLAMAFFSGLLAAVCAALLWVFNRYNHRPV